MAAFHISNFYRHLPPSFRNNLYGFEKTVKTLIKARHGLKFGYTMHHTKIKVTKFERPMTFKLFVTLIIII